MLQVLNFTHVCMHMHIMNVDNIPSIFRVATIFVLFSHYVNNS